MVKVTNKEIAMSICQAIKCNLKFIKSVTYNKSIKLLIIGFDSNIDSIIELISDSSEESWK